MGTTRIKVIDLSSQNKEIKTSRKHAEKLTSLGQAKKVDQKIEPRSQSERDEKKAPKNVDETAAVEAHEITETKDVTPANEEVLETSETEESVAADKVEPVKSKPSASSKKTQSHHKGKKYLEAKNAIEDKLYTTDEALSTLPKTSYVKFDPTVEIHLTVADKTIKGSVNFPHLKTEAKEKKYLIFADKQNTSLNKKIIWADAKTIAEVESGQIRPGRDFDTVISTPKFMPQLAKIAKILGPKGMMPNPKNGTIVENIEKALDDNSKDNSYTFKCDPTTPVIHTKIGKLSQKEDELKGNLRALASAIGKSKIKKAYITTTMGPAIQLDTASL